MNLITTELYFQIRNTLSAQLWAKSIKQAIPEGLRETNLFYNFPGQHRSELNYLLNSLNIIIHSLSSLHPELIFRMKKSGVTSIQFYIILKQFSPTICQ